MGNWWDLRSTDRVRPVITELLGWRIARSGSSSSLLRPAIRISIKLNIYNQISFVEVMGSLWLYDVYESVAPQFDYVIL